MNSEPLLLEVKSLQKSFSEANQTITLFKQLNLCCKEGESLCLIGPSGSGKSTLLHLIGLLDTPDEGTISLNGNVVSQLKEKDKNKIRSKEIGFVFQKHLLIKELTLIENIMLPLLQTGCSTHVARSEATKLIELAGLNKRAFARPNQMSGGENQRGAICRALIQKPKLLLMDEPTGNLDPDLGKELILKVLKMSKENQMGVIIVTHNHDFIKFFDSSFELSHGILKKIKP